MFAVLTDASRRALDGLRDFGTLQWYAVPLLALLFYIYATEIQKARRSGDWDAIVAGVTLFGMDFVNESWNGWVMVLSDRSAFWTAPGPTALRTMVGWNLEIMFMFAISGLIYYHSLSDDPEKRPLARRREAWLIAAAYSAFCVFIEIFLNKGGLLIWEYSFWNRSFGGVWLIFLIGYFHFYVGVILVLSLRSVRARLFAVAGIYTVAIALNVIGMGVMGWRY
ncbi:MAG: hypothetical protein KC609_00060 [Myxococcales bacterium]|nr:hypothetical protein [Myxococcales bacterium]